MGLAQSGDEKRMTAPPTESRGKVVVFTDDPGLTAALSTVAGASRLVPRPAAALGDVWGQIRADVSALVIVDCHHGNGPSVWHREIASALAAGIRVLGAGGTGALRAVEMGPMGMGGQGVLFSLASRETIVRDEDFMVGADGFCLALLNQALARAVGGLGHDLAEALTRHCRQTFYPRRSWAQVTTWIHHHLPPSQAGPAAHGLRDHAAAIRRQDVLAAVALALASPPEKEGPNEAPDPVRCLLRPRWQLTEIGFRPFVLGERTVDGHKVLAAARKTLPRWRARLRNEFFIHRWALEHGFAPPPEQVARNRDAALTRHADGFQSFLLANALTRMEWDALMERACLVDWAQARRGDLLPTVADPFPFAARWAVEHGIDVPENESGALGAWVVERGPDFFGLAWEEPVALMEALRLSGAAEHLARAVLDGDGP